MTDVNITQFTLNDEPEKRNQEALPGDDLTKLNGVGKSLELKLKEKGFTIFSKIAECTPQRLSRKIEGVGINKAQTIITSAKELIEAVNFKKTSEKNDDGKLMFDPKYKIDRTSKTIPSQKDLNKPKYLEYPLEEEEEKEGVDEIDTKNATEYDSFIVEPFEKEEYPIEKLSDYLDIDEKEAMSSNTQSNSEQEDVSKKEENGNSFDPETEARIKSLVNTFIERKNDVDNNDDDYWNTSLLEKEQELEEDSHIYEDDIEIEKEVISNVELNEFIVEAREGFQSKGYAIISHLIENIDFLALKFFKIDDELKIISLFPVKVCNLEGSLIIANSKIDYYPLYKEYEANEFVTEELLGHIGKAMKKAQDHILWNIFTERSLFQYIRKKFERKLELKKTKRGKKLFFRVGQTHYKIIVNPIVLCKKTTEFKEKILPFPYQCESNIHFIQTNKLPNLLEFLEQKYHLIENRYNNENVVKTYFHAQNRFIANTRYYSIPFVGILISLLIITCSMPLFSHISFNLSLGVITVYVIILGFLYLNFYKKKEEIAHEFATPYHMRIVNLDETDLEIIQEKLSIELMEQFIYESFGKGADFHIVARIEAQKANAIHYRREAEYTDLFTEEEGVDEFLFAKGKNGDEKKKNRAIGTNYHLFMED
ncbi:MAG: helix-hairpin-helix domain-containing protein [Promethearchaeota archaeon]